MKINRHCKAILFDFDGVLVDSEPLYAQAWERVLKPYDLHMAENWNRAFIGVPDQDMAGILVDEYQLPVHPDDLLAQKREAFAQTEMNEMLPFKGLQTQLEKLAQLKRAVVSSSALSQIAPVLQKDDLLQFFDVFVCAGDVKRCKPAPDPYLLAAEKLGVLPVDCIVLEDSGPGVLSARSAGMSVIAIETSDTNSTFRADKSFSSTLEALKWIIKVLYTN